MRFARCASLHPVEPPVVVEVLVCAEVVVHADVLGSRPMIFLISLLRSSCDVVPSTFACPLVLDMNRSASSRCVVLPAPLGQEPEDRLSSGGSGPSTAVDAVELLVRFSVRSL